MRQLRLCVTAMSMMAIGAAVFGQDDAVASGAGVSDGVGSGVSFVISFGVSFGSGGGGGGGNSALSIYESLP